jgi:hypothetical protein
MGIFQMIDTTQLMATLRTLGNGQSDAAFIAKRLAVGIERQHLPEDVIMSLVAMSPDAIAALITRLSTRQSTIYDLPRHLVTLFAQRFAHTPKGPRALQL